MLRTARTLEYYVMTKARKAPTAAFIAAPVAPVAPSIVIVDGKPVDVNVDATELAVIIDEMVAAEAQSYGSHIRIAAKLNSLMPDFNWFDINHQEVSDNATAMKPHWKAVYDGFKRAGHTNPSVPGKRIRDYARNLRAGLAPNGKTLADGSALPNNVTPNGEGEGANPAKRSDKLAAIEDGTKLYKRMAKSDNATLVAFADDIAAAMKKHLGFDVRTAK